MIKVEHEFAALIEAIEASESRMMEEVPEKVELVKRICNLVREFTRKSPGVKVTYSLHEPFVRCGSVKVLADEIVVDDPRKLSLAIELSHTFEIFTRTDGSVQMNFGFEGIAREVE